MYYEIGRCSAPCVDEWTHDYDAEVDRVRAFLRGEDESVLDRLRDRMHAAAANLEFEDAKRYRDWITRLQTLFVRQRQIASNVVDHNAVIVLPDDNRPVVHFFFVQFGRLESALHLESVELRKTQRHD